MRNKGVERVRRSKRKTNIPPWPHCKMEILRWELCTSAKQIAHFCSLIGMFEHSCSFCIELLKHASHLSQWKISSALPIRHNPHLSQWWMSNFVHNRHFSQCVRPNSRWQFIHAADGGWFISHWLQHTLVIIGGFTSHPVLIKAIEQGKREMRKLNWRGNTKG